MKENNSDIKSLILIPNNNLIKVGKSIAITNKLLEEKTRRELATVFKSVKIGTQIWMTENLNVDRYRNGDTIPQVKDPVEWENLNTGASYDNGYDPEKEGKMYGKLYNWYAINDPRGLAPVGWHVPTDTEWTTLTDELGGENIAGNKMKNNSGWNYPNKSSNGTNESGFAGLPCGICNLDMDSVWSNFNYRGYWWSSTECQYGYQYTVVWNRSLQYENGNIYRGQSYKQDGLSVRCLRD